MSYVATPLAYTHSAGTARTSTYKQVRTYSTTSSVCSTTSSIQSSISSFSSLCLSSSGSGFLPRSRRSYTNSVLTRLRQAFHSSTRRLRSAMSSALMLLSSAASSSSNWRLNSLRLRRICRCCSFPRSVRGRGRQRNCLKRSRMCFSSSWPRKSQIA